ncbi:pentatricopeptide repeat-containing protein At1g09900-like [Cornus florida]|uniref:pentatricopeptide repeat-containing protein At1g09900-like n=1 Tax=Cornus florida TaxID=4283 RepID=UPI002896925C|nr:pentatricopeptide repeat-containing protein At1g09900-like [Cornus florida]
MSNGTTFADKNSEFENLDGDGSDDSQLTKRSVDGFGSNVSPKQIRENIELIRNDEDETMVSDETNGFENLDSVGSDDSQMKKRKVDGVESNAIPKQFSKIVELIRSNENDLESKLNVIGASLSVRSVSEVFRVLNLARVSGLRYFEWVLGRNRQLYYNADVCSLIIDNCGRLDDYETMICLLKNFSTHRICLTEKAFGFLLVLGSNKDLVKGSIERVINVLNEAGGSCRGSGIWALIKMFVSQDSFEMAEFVMGKTERKVSYYNIFIREKCRKCHFEEALGMLEEMRQFGCEPNVTTYNYLLSSLCKNERLAEACSVLEEIQEKGCHPDALTFEIFIYYSYRLGKIDSAVQFLDRMVSVGLEPRPQTHAAFIKGYFNLGKYEEAHQYVIDTGVKYEHSSNMNYSLLASLHEREGKLSVAIDILIEMMDKGLKPQFSLYRRILKRLQNSSQARSVARDLVGRFSRLRSESSE